MAWDSPAVIAVSSVAGIVTLLHALRPFVLRPKPGREKTGDKDPEYWLEHLNEIKGILQARNVVFTSIDAKLTALKESTTRIESSVNDAIRARSRGGR